VNESLGGTGGAGGVVTVGVVAMVWAGEVVGAVTDNS
jgi:hypothetical protein